LLRIYKGKKYIKIINQNHINDIYIYTNTLSLMCVLVSARKREVQNIQLQIHVLEYNYYVEAS